MGLGGATRLGRPTQGTSNEAVAAAASRCTGRRPRGRQDSCFPRLARRQTPRSARAGPLARPPGRPFLRGAVAVGRAPARGPADAPSQKKRPRARLKIGTFPTGNAVAGRPRAFKAGLAALQGGQVRSRGARWAGRPSCAARCSATGTYDVHGKPLPSSAR